MTGRALVRASIAASLVVAACVPDATPDRRPAAAAVSTAAAVGPARFGFGAPADPARVAAWDIDVRHDGVGLPAGRGTVAAGERVYATRCLACHGPTGTEGPYDALAGGEPWGPGDAPRRRTIGNYWPYATTLFDYVRRAMPQNAPGSLSADETYAVVAWLLERNGIVGEDAVMDARTLPAVVMPARDRFVPDDRRGGAEVR